VRITNHNKIDFHFVEYLFLAASVNSAWSYQVRVQVNCVNDTIVEMPTLTPFGMNHSDVFQVNNNTWGMNFYWTPRINQTGRNV